MVNTIQIPNVHYQANQCKTNRTNRTAATTAVGSVGFVDSPQSNAASTTVELANDNVVAVTTALMAKRPRLVVSTGVTANAVRGDFIEGHKVACQILVDGTVAVVAGDKLKPVNAQNYMVKATIATDYYYAEVLEAYAVGATRKLLRCLLWSDGNI